MHLAFFLQEPVSKNRAQQPTEAMNELLRAKLKNNTKLKQSKLKCFKIGHIVSSLP